MSTADNRSNSPFSVDEIMGQLQNMSKTRLLLQCYLLRIRSPEHKINSHSNRSQLLGAIHGQLVYNANHGVGNYKRSENGFYMLEDPLPSSLP